MLFSGTSGNYVRAALGSRAADWLPLQYADCMQHEKTLLQPLTTS